MALVSIPAATSTLRSAAVPPMVAAAGTDTNASALVDGNTSASRDR